MIMNRLLAISNTNACDHILSKALVSIIVGLPNKKRLRRSVAADQIGYWLPPMKSRQPNRRFDDVYSHFSDPPPFSKPALIPLSFIVPFPCQLLLSAAMEYSSGTS
ncbi:unnamed protein product [Linum tenue]|uniref:Uncharacterized protein n=1 Tax=Linum tenue TaxID=586396 RepID=A0AAV0LXK2_9ROSI|nr:unnamed protein product [Linum tenue]